MNELEYAKNLAYLQSENPAGFLAMAALVSGASTEKTGAKIAADFKKYKPNAERAMFLLRDYLKTEGSKEVQDMIDPACAWLHKYFLDSQTPAQKAADTTRRRREAKDAELRQQHLDAEATKKLARSVLHDENADPAARLEAAGILEGMR